ncbi:MAG: LamG domain-containing protein [Planctomycetota bacterium]|jgi:hypothetical protein
MRPTLLLLACSTLLLVPITGCVDPVSGGSGGDAGESLEGPEQPQPSAPYPAEAQPGDLVGHWRFEEDTGTAYDDSKFGNHGSIRGPEACEAFSGRGLKFRGGGEYFDGDAVAVPHSPSLDVTRPFFVEAMIRLTGTDRIYAVADKYRYLGESNEEGFSLYLVSGRLCLRVGSGDWGAREVTGTSDLRDGAWHHVGGVWDGEKIAVRVDGRTEAATLWGRGPASTPNGLGIGKRLSGWNGFMPFEGDIDSVEIGLRLPGLIPQPPPPPPPTFVLGEWLFEGNTNTAVDETDFRNDGVIFGAARSTGFSGRGLRFAGGGQFFNGDGVVVPNSASLDITGPFAVEAMIRVTGQATYYAIVDKYRYLGGNTARGFTLYLTNGKLRMSIYSGSNGIGNTSGTSDLRDGLWHHVRGVWDGGNILLYVDRQLERNVPWTFGPASTTNDLGIGKRLSGWGGYMPFEGNLDSVKVERLP